jgi:3-deoxy-D-manno-octulosonic-acid transferase
MKLFLYNFLLLLITPFMVSRLLIKSYRDKDYRLNLRHRFGMYKKSKSKEVVWFHAVSLGEVISSQQIVIEILKEHDVVLTVSTPTGLREARKIFGTSLEIVFAPWDFIFFVNGFFKSFNPIALILFETEIWPSMISRADHKKIPIIISNARMSEISYKNYIKFSYLFSSTMKKISLVFAQSNDHKIRFNKLGVSLNRIEEVGSVKFDINTTSDNFIKMPSDKKFILAASTHKEEDELIIAAFIKLQGEFQDLKLIIVPRHPDRAKSIQTLVNKNGLIGDISSSIPQNFNNNNVIIIQATGLMRELYSKASIAFIGGSLFKKYGGHNIIEAAAEKCPFIVGPYTHNFEDIVDLFSKNNSCIQLDQKKDIFNAFKTLLNDSKLRDDMAISALNICTDNKGSTKKQYTKILNTIRGAGNETSNSNN